MMRIRKHIIITSGLSMLSSFLLAQDSKNMEYRGLYISVGILRVGYSKSTIHFYNAKMANYDFDLIKARGVDEPAFSLHNPKNAQYCYRVGYFFNEDRKFGIEFNYDHTKYVLEQGQKLRLKGMINGTQYDKDTTITKNFIEYEHTDGANYYMVNFVAHKYLIGSAGKIHSLSAVLKPGIGVAIPRTFSHVMSLESSDKYQVSGYIAGVEAGVRFNIFKDVFTEVTGKGVYVNYFDIILTGRGKAKQDWFSYEGIVTIGYQFHSKKRK